MNDQEFLENYDNLTKAVGPRSPVFHKITRSDTGQPQPQPSDEQFLKEYDQATAASFKPPMEEPDTTWKGTLKQQLKPSPTAETVAHLGYGMASWIPSKLSGLGQIGFQKLNNAIFGSEAKNIKRTPEEREMFRKGVYSPEKIREMAEQSEALWQILPPPESKEAKFVLEKVGEGLDWALTHFRVADEYYTEKGYPNLGYALRFMGEFIFFKAAHGFGVRTSAKLKKLRRKVTKKAPAVEVEKTLEEVFDEIGVPKEEVAPKGDELKRVTKSQKIKAHKIQRENSLSKVEYMKIAERVSGETSIKDMNKASAKRFIEELKKGKEVVKIEPTKEVKEVKIEEKKAPPVERPVVEEKIVEPIVEKPPVEEPKPSIDTPESLAEEFDLRYMGEMGDLKLYSMKVPKGETTIATKGVSREALVKRIKETREEFEAAEVKEKIAEPKSLEAEIHREISVEDVTDPFVGEPLTHLRIKSYPAGYEQVKSGKVIVGRVTERGEYKDSRIIPKGTPIIKKKIVDELLSPYWIEGKNKAGEWIEISRYDDLREAEIDLNKFEGREPLKLVEEPPTKVKSSEVKPEPPSDAVKTLISDDIRTAEDMGIYAEVKEMLGEKKKVGEIMKEVKQKAYYKEDLADFGYVEKDIRESIRAIKAEMGDEGAIKQIQRMIKVEEKKVEKITEAEELEPPVDVERVDPLTGRPAGVKEDLISVPKEVDEIRMKWEQEQVPITREDGSIAKSKFVAMKRAKELGRTGDLVKNPKGEGWLVKKTKEQRETKAKEEAKEWEDILKEEELGDLGDEGLGERVDVDIDTVFDPLRGERGSIEISTEIPSIVKEKFKKLLRLGRDRVIKRNEDIRKETGWWLDPEDGNWYREFSTKDLKLHEDKFREVKGFYTEDGFKINKEGYLKDILEFPALFERYPFLNKIKVQIVPDLDGAARVKTELIYREVEPSSRMIKIRKELKNINSSIDSLGPTYHEVAALANKYGIDATLRKEFPKIDQALQLFKDKWKIVDEMNKISIEESSKSIKELPIGLKATILLKRFKLDNLIHEVQHLIQEKTGVSSGFAYQRGSLRNYLLNKGEIRAELTADRIKMSEELKDKISPLTTQKDLMEEIFDFLKNEKGVITFHRKTVKELKRIVKKGYYTRNRIIRELRKRGASDVDILKVFPDASVRILNKGKESKWWKEGQDPLELLPRRTLPNKLKAPAITRGEAHMIATMKDMPARLTAEHLSWENAIRTFEKLPKEMKETFYRTVDEGVSLAFDHLRDILKRSKKIRNSVMYISHKRIGIHAIAQQSDGVAVLAQQGITKIPKLRPKELKAYEDLRIIYDELFPLINKARIAAGEKPFPKMENYFTWIQDLHWLQKTHGIGLFSNWRTLESKMAEIKRVPGFRFAKFRAGPERPRKLHLNPFAVVDVYAKTATHYIEMAPRLAKLNELLTEKYGMTQNAPHAYNFIRHWLNFQAGKIPAWDIAHPITRRAMQILNSNIVYSLLAFNIRSALIQPAALASSYAVLGEYYMGVGLAQVMSPSKWKMAGKKSNKLNTRTPEVALYEAMESGGRIPGLIQRRIGQAGLLPLTVLDSVAARITWLGAYEMGLKKLKLSERNAINYADDIVTKTQASAARSDIAPIQRTQLGKTVTCLQTFVINHWGFLTKDVMGIKNADIKNPVIVKRVIRFILATTAMNALYEDGLGMNSPNPTPIRAFREKFEETENYKEAFSASIKEIAEYIPLFGGRLRYGTDLGGPVVAECLKLIDKGDEEALIKLMGIPGSNQFFKMVRAHERGGTDIDIALGRYVEPDKDKIKSLTAPIEP